MVEAGAVRNGAFPGGREALSASRSVLIAHGTFACALLAANYSPFDYLATAVGLLYFLFYFADTSLRIPRELPRFLAIPALLSIIGIAGSRGHETYDALKDCWYFLNPILMMTAGYLIMQRMRAITAVLLIFVAGGFLLAGMHVFTVLANPSLLESPVADIRAEAGAGNFLTLLSIAIIVAAKQSGLALFRSPRAGRLVPFIALVDLGSIFFSFSRTLWVSLVIFLILGSPVIIHNGKRVLAVALPVLVAAALFASTFSGERPDMDSMSGKVLYSLEEMTLGDYDTLSDISAHWRGYESLMALNAFLEGSLFERLFGQGFGTLVDLHMEIELGEETFSAIPTLHNGYLYLLVKTGAAGLSLYLVYLASFLITGLRLSRSIDEHRAFAGRVLAGCVVVLLFTTAVISGMFNKGGLVPVMMLLGACLSLVNAGREREQAGGQRI